MRVDTEYGKRYYTRGRTRDRIRDRIRDSSKRSLLFLVENHKLICERRRDLCVFSLCPPWTFPWITKTRYYSYREWRKGGVWWWWWWRQRRGEDKDEDDTRKIKGTDTRVVRGKNEEVQVYGECDRMSTKTRGDDKLRVKQYDEDRDAGKRDKCFSNSTSDLTECVSWIMRLQKLPEMKCSRFSLDSLAWIISLLFTGFFPLWLQWNGTRKVIWQTFETRVVIFPLWYSSSLFSTSILSHKHTEWVIFLLVVSDVTVVCLCRLIYYLLLSTTVLSRSSTRMQSSQQYPVSSSSSFIIILKHNRNEWHVHEYEVTWFLPWMTKLAQLLNPNHKRRNENGTLLSHDAVQSPVFTIFLTAAAVLVVVMMIKL